MEPTPQSNARQREPIMHRTAPEAAPMVAGRATGWGTRRQAIVGVTMLAVGIALALGAVIALGGRVFPTFATARETGADAASVFFMGAQGSTLELVLVIGLIVLLPVGIVVGWLGYRRITDDGPSLAGVHQSNSPNAVMNQLGIDGS
ncbi:hypothetical protein [Agrococcus baldri]|uniref:Uncharacterized protein n=1 Tax=Agrococcus baldri TaxID=153730 RepID=A0AA87RJH4_9MICO|nr:hypothetical protein [Agrococcus baldri]GEK81549.1 hypothetical protein ABA31_29000 [Agrococcus baldri]